MILEEKHNYSDGLWDIPIKITIQDNYVTPKLSCIVKVELVKDKPHIPIKMSKQQ